ncbi:hypothetical protein HII36_43940, partial [Nonomuraea sp. NN258]|uniref:hypothetical protein n=1 Tax=Nonomuraea antri TaxID=2730852 RepID=UPI001567DF15
MRRPLGVLAGLVSLAALGAPLTPANAATVQQAQCRLIVGKPYVTAANKIQATAGLRGCEAGTPLQVRIKRAQRGPDPVVVRSGSGTRATPGQRITVALPCAPGLYYAEASDQRGNTRRSRPVRLT